MKNRLLLAAAGLLVPALCFGQSSVKARAVSVDTNGLNPIVTIENAQGAISQLVVRVVGLTNSVNELEIDLLALSNRVTLVEGEAETNATNIASNTTDIASIQSKRVNIGPMTGTINQPSIQIAADDSYSFIPEDSSTGYSIDRNGQEVFFYVSMDGPRKGLDSNLMYAKRDYSATAGDGMFLDKDPQDLSAFTELASNRVFRVRNATKYSMVLSAIETNTFAEKQVFVIHNADTDPANWTDANVIDVTLLTSNTQSSLEYVPPDVLGTAAGDGRIIYSDWVETGGGTGDFPIIEMKVFEEANFKLFVDSSIASLTNVVTTNSALTDTAMLFDMADKTEGGWVERLTSAPSGATTSYKRDKTGPWSDLHNMSFYNVNDQKFVLLFGGREVVKNDANVTILTTSGPFITVNNAYALTVSDLATGTTSYDVLASADLQPSDTANTNFYKWAQGKSYGTSVQGANKKASLNTHNNDTPGSMQDLNVAIYHDPSFNATRAFAGEYGTIFLTDVSDRPLHTLVPDLTGVVYTALTNTVPSLLDYTAYTLFNDIGSRPFNVAQAQDDYWTRYFVSIFGAGFSPQDDFQEIFYDSVSDRTIVVAKLNAEEATTGYTRAAVVMKATNSWSNLFGTKDILEPEPNAVRYLPDHDVFDTTEYTNWTTFPDETNFVYWTTNLMYQAIMEHDYAVGVEGGTNQNAVYYLLYPNEKIMTFSWTAQTNDAGVYLPHLDVSLLSPQVIFPDITIASDFYPFAIHHAEVDSSTNWLAWTNNFTQGDYIDRICNLAYDKDNGHFYATGVDVSRTEADAEWRMQEVYVYTNNSTAWEKCWMYEPDTNLFVEATVAYSRSLANEAANGEIYNTKKGAIVTENGWYIPGCSSRASGYDLYLPGIAEGYRFYRKIGGKVEAHYLPATSGSMGTILYSFKTAKYSFLENFGYMVWTEVRPALTNNIDPNDEIIGSTRKSWITSRDYPNSTAHLSSPWEDVMGTGCELGAVQTNASGGITNVVIVAEGTGYVSAVVGVFDLSDLGSSGALTAQLGVGGGVTNIVIGTAGSGYSTNTFATVIDDNPAGFFGQLNEADAANNLTEHSLLAQGPSGLIAYIQPGKLLLGGYYYDDITSVIPSSQVSLNASGNTYIYATATGPENVVITTSRYPGTVMSYNTVLLGLFTCDADGVTSSTIYSHYINVTTSP